MLRLTTALALALTVSAPAAFAQDAAAAIGARQAIMKYLGGNMRSMAGMAQGKLDFNADYVKAFGTAAATMASSYVLLFPDGSMEGGNNKAAPAIFSDRAGFEAEAAKLAAAATAMAAATTAEEMAATFGAVGGSCSSCHKGYRLE